MNLSAKPNGPCENCGERPATTWWTAEGGGLAFVHGFAVGWCMVCALTEQIKHLEKRLVQLPVMKARLAALLEGSMTDEEAMVFPEVKL
jgi:hypothetical protein